MILYAVNDPVKIPYHDILTEFSQLKIGLCSLRASDYDGNFVKFYLEKIQALGQIDRLVIDDFTEATQLDNIENLVSEVVETCNIPKKHIVFVDGGDYASQHVISYPTFYSLSDFRLLQYDQHTVVPWEDRDKLLLSLCRRPTWFRVALTEELIKRNLLEHSIVSCGSDSDSESDGWQDFFVTSDLRHHFPLLVDGFLSREQEIFQSGIEFSRAFVNVVSETSHDQMPNMVFNLSAHLAADPKNRTPSGLHHWNRLFVTEKTIKAIAMRQIPIFNTVRHHVRLLRAMGLDLFDDIVDHSYDEIEDPILRIQTVAKQAEFLYRCGHNYFKNIPNIKQRLEHNVNCIKHQEKIRKQSAEHKIREFLNHGHVTI